MMFNHFTANPNSILIPTGRLKTYRPNRMLPKAEDRAHILEGLRKALDFIDEIIAIIRGSHDTEVAKAQLIERFEFSPIQAQAILDMRLARLTGLEREKIEAEYNDLMELIRRLTEILSSEANIMAIIENELADIKNQIRF